VRKLFIGIGAAILILIIVGLALPRRLHVEVTAAIDAHPATVFALVDDFHRVSLWSTRLEADPNARVEYSGPKRGVGAAMSWDGAIIGAGSEAITESRPYEYVGLAIDPDSQNPARSWFSLEPRDDGTRVTWGFERDYGFNLAGRYLALLQKGVVRRERQAGIAALGELAESLPDADFSDLEIEQIQVEALTIAYLPASSLPDPAAISEAMGAAYFEILTYIDRHGLTAAGAPMSIMRSFSGARLSFDAAIPVRGDTEAAAKDAATVRIGKTYAGPVIRVRHVGPYRDLGNTHRKIAAYLAALGIERAGAAWESYVSDPTKVPESELVTYVYYPIKP
jgi:DNA gyrase inhibitor GyrI